MFEYRRQPLKSLYYFYTLLYLAGKVSYWTAGAILAGARPRRSWTLKRVLFTGVFRTLVNGAFRTGFEFTMVEPQVEERAASSTGFVWVDWVPEEYVTGEIASMAKQNGVVPARVWGYWYGRRDADGNHGQRAEPGEKMLYVLHGGGYVGGSGTPNGLGEPTIINGILGRSGSLLTRAFALDYRLCAAAPYPISNSFPAPLIDALSGYRYLVETLGFLPTNIVVEGDSAGAHLAIALTRYLLTSMLPSPLPTPGGLLLVSPSTDWAGTHPRDGPEPCSLRDNHDSDWVAGFASSDYVPRALLGHLPPEEIHNPYLSPASRKIDDPARFFTNFPPTCIVAGGAEQTLDAMVTFRERVEAGSGKACVTYLEYEDAIHDFLAFEWHEPERSQALKDIGAWLGSIPSVVS